MTDPTRGKREMGVLRDLAIRAAGRTDQPVMLSEVDPFIDYSARAAREGPFTHAGGDVAELASARTYDLRRLHEAGLIRAGMVRTPGPDGADVPVGWAVYVTAEGYAALREAGRGRVARAVNLRQFVAAVVIAITAGVAGYLIGACDRATDRRAPQDAGAEVEGEPIPAGCE